MISVAILYEDEKPIRVFKEGSCIYNAYKWAHHHFCLSDSEPKLKLYQLPEWLTVKYFLMTEEQFREIIK